MQTECESVLQQEIRLMKLQYKGLSYYTATQQEQLFQSREKFPQTFAGRSVVVMTTENCFASRITVLMVKLLELAYEDPSQILLRRIKQVAYDEDVNLTAFQGSNGHMDIDDKAMRKLFVQFFHLTACDKHPNKVMHSLAKHVVIRAGLAMIARSILHALGICNALESQQSTLKQVVQPICKFFKVPFIEEEHGIFKFCEDHFIAETVDALYKSVAPSQQQHPNSSKNDSCLLSSIGSSEEQLSRQILEKSIIKQLELTEERGQVPESRRQTTLPNTQTFQQFVARVGKQASKHEQSRISPNPLSRRLTTTEVIEVTPERVNLPFSTKSPISLNKPISSRSIAKGGQSKSPIPLNRNRTINENCSPNSRPFTNNYSFGLKKQSKVTAGPLRQLVGGPVQRSPLETVPSLRFRNLLNRKV